MADHQAHSQASQEAEAEAQNFWDSFTVVTKYGVILTVIVLILMAIFLL